MFPYTSRKKLLATLDMLFPLIISQNIPNSGQLNNHFFFVFAK